MRFDILTLFPGMFEKVLGESIIGRAVAKNIIKIRLHNLRDFSTDKHKRVDDYPYGGGLGMVLQCQPIFTALDYLTEDIGEKPYVILMSPQGRVFNQNKARSFLKHKNIVIICGHYEGVDERVIVNIIDEEISLGDFVLTGGEIAAMAIVDSTARLVPGVLKEEESHWNETFSEGLLEYPQYTRPAEYLGLKVPEILLTGHHANIEKWRKAESIKRTFKKRPDLIKKAVLSKDELIILEEIENEK
ncbi:MAG: tRNA (guanosine(37)-N1)-methyltransferase TrmD [Clostridiales bacterium]|nr:tRNA (guanosine(37)-N1)-methyltransferase TrmD [Clostridiales bacterium]